MTDTRFVRGASRLRRRIQTIRANAQTVFQTEYLQNSLGQLMLRRMQERFNRQVDPDGKAWPAASSRTTARKGGRGKLLYRSGTLYRGIQIIRGSNQGTLAVNTGAGFRIGIPADNEAAVYGRYHQFGIGQKQRRFIGVGELDRKAVDSLLRRAIIGRTGG